MRKVPNYLPHIETRKLITCRVFDAFDVLGLESGPRRDLIPQKPQTKKSHATVPLKLRKVITLHVFDGGNKTKILCWVQFFSS